MYNGEVDTPQFFYSTLASLGTLCVVSALLLRYLLRYLSTLAPKHTDYAK